MSLTSSLPYSSPPADRESPAGDAAGQHPVVDEAAFQVVGVNPFRCRGVVLVRDQNRQGETAQQPLGGSFPVGFGGTNGDQLACERQGGSGQPEFGTEPIANAQVDQGNVALAGAQAAQLGVDLFCLLAECLFITAELHQTVLEIRLGLFQTRTRGGHVPPAYR